MMVIKRKDFPQIALDVGHKAAAEAAPASTQVASQEAGAFGSFKGKDRFCPFFGMT